MKLQLHKSLCMFDLETTGVNVGSDRIVEIAILKILPTGEEKTYVQRVNPQMPIPAATTAIHGISDEDIADAPTFNQIANEIAQFIGNSDLGGYNSNKFDLPLLAEEFLRAGVDFSLEHRKFVDVQNIFHKMEQRTLKAAYKFYCGEEIKNHHSAEADIRATWDVFKAQLERYEELKPEIEFLSAFSTVQKNVDPAGRVVFNDKNIEVFNFGKYKGRAVEDVFKMEPTYYDWMMNGDFPEYTKKVITAIRLRGIKK